MLTRAEFKAAINNGIVNAPDLSTAERVRLRHIGDTATSVGWGFEDGPGCPITQAGYYAPDRSLSVGLNQFWPAYDRAVRMIVHLAGRMRDPIGDEIVDGPTIPRSTLQAIVRAASSHAGLEQHEVESVRNWASTVTGKVARVTFEREGVSCPLQSAGVVDHKVKEGESGGVQERHWNFVSSYDNGTRQIVGDERIFTVLG